MNISPYEKVFDIFVESNMSNVNLIPTCYIILTDLDALITSIAIQI